MDHGCEPLTMELGCRLHSPPLDRDLELLFIWVGGRLSPLPFFSDHFAYCMYMKFVYMVSMLSSWVFAKILWGKRMLNFVLVIIILSRLPENRTSKLYTSIEII